MDVASFASYAGASILRVAYGITSEEEKAYYVKLASLATESFIAGSNHGSFMVDYIPSLKYLPCMCIQNQIRLVSSNPMILIAWAPGAAFKRKAEVWAKYISGLNHHPWQKLKSLVASS